MIFVHELFFSSVDGRRRERESRLFSTDPECVTAAYCRDWRRGPSVVYQGRRLKMHLAKLNFPEVLLLSCKRARTA